MANYVVLWAIDVEACSMQEAAKLAREAQTREGTTATVFHVSLSRQTDGKVAEVLERCTQVDTETAVE